MKTAIFLLSSLVTVFLFNTPTSYAVEDTKKDEKPKQNIVERQAQTKTESCQKIREKIAQKATGYDSNRKAKEDLYLKIITKLSEIKSLLEAKGADTATISSNISILEQKIQKYWDDRNAVITKLNESSDFSCEQGDKETFKNRLKEARELHKIVLMDAKDIREFLTTKVKDSIKLARTSLKKEGE
jgi:hypothetical protein